MELEIHLAHKPIAETISPPPAVGARGAWLEFRGVVRGEENGQAISALEYEAYSPMAENEIRRILESLALKHPCLAVLVIHRLGIIPAGETAIYVGLASLHRREAVALLAEFMDCLKQDVPIWKRRALPASEHGPARRSTSAQPRAVRAAAGHKPALHSLDDALAEIRSHCQPLPAVNAPLAECFGRVLREAVGAPSDFPDCDRSTRDGYAILRNDESEAFTIVDTLHAADWRPRQLKSGETVRIATGAALPGGNLRVVMQENAERKGQQIQIIRREEALNIRERGEDLKAGQTLVRAGTRLDTGKLAMLASAGHVQPLVNPPLRVIHFTTGDEIVPPDQTPKPGQIRDSNSLLIRSLLQDCSCDLRQAHLPEDFAAAKRKIKTFDPQPATCHLLLVSGGASVGEKDFTRPLLEWLGFEIVFSQVNVRPGRPLIFGVSGNRIAFGLPGNPLSHFVCFHVFVAAALAKLIGRQSGHFLRTRLTAQLDDAPNPRETLWPARLDLAGLHPLRWASSGSVICLVETNALIRVPVNQGSIEPGVEVDFLPTTDMLDNV